MKHSHWIFSAGASILLASGFAVAQATTPATPATPAIPATRTTSATPATPATPATNTPAHKHLNINQREENQQDRIAQGIKSGKLTPGDAAQLEQQQQRIDSKVATDRAANGGKLTKKEKQQIRRRQNRASHNIYKEKHESGRR